MPDPPNLQIRPLVKTAYSSEAARRQESFTDGLPGRPRPRPLARGRCGSGPLHALPNDTAAAFRGACAAQTARAPIYLWHSARVPSVDKRPRFGTITPSFYAVGLLLPRICPHVPAGALLFSKILRFCYEISLSTQNTNRSAPPAKQPPQLFR